MRSGNPNGQPKLTPEQVRHIAAVFRVGGRRAAVRLHSTYGVTKSTVDKIIAGVNWSHITGIPKPEEVLI